MSNLVSNIFGQPSVDGAACVASESCASGHDGCCAQASAFVSETGAELRYTGPSEVALCDVEHNVLLREEFSLVEHVDFEHQQAESRVALAKCGEEEDKAKEKAGIHYCMSIDLHMPLNCRSDGFFIYGNSFVNELRNNGFNGFLDTCWDPQTIIEFVRQKAHILASECYEVMMLKDVFISLWALDVGGVCDIIRNVVIPIFVARRAAEFCKMAVLYKEFQVEKQAAYVRDLPEEEDDMYDRDCRAVWHGY